MPNLPEPRGPGYRDRYEELWRLAEEKYGGGRQDTGRMLLRLGEPAEIFKPRCGDEQVFYGLEVWTYNNLGYSGRRTERYIFYRRFSNGPYKLYTGVERAAEVFIQNSCRRSFGSLSADCKIGDSRCGPCGDRCTVYQAYRESLQRTNADLIELSRLFEPIPISTEGLERQKNRWATISNPKAKVIHVEGPSSGIGAPTPSPTASPSPPSGPPRKLSADEIRDRIRQLEPKYKEWLDLARPLLSEEELSLFLQVRPKEKDAFIEKFWKSRS